MIFCPICGVKTLDGAAFCQKCSAKLIVGDGAQKAVTSYLPKKKNFRKLPALLATAGLVFVMTIVVSGCSNAEERGEKAQKDEGVVTSDQQPLAAKLSETYANETAGISFDYPAGWAIMDSDSEFEVVEMIDSSNNADSIAGFKVSRILDQNPLGVFTGDEESVKEAVNESATFIKFAHTLIGEVTAKGVTYQKAGLKGDDIVANYWYAIGGDVYQITCSYSATKADTYEPIFDAIMASYTINAADARAASTKAEYIAAYSAKVQELDAESSELKFALIDLIGSDVPQLVADNIGYSVSVFTWADGSLVTLMDNYGYGAGGNAGYSYLPGGNVIYNLNSDMAGAIIYETYLTVNDANEVVDLHDKELSCWYFKDVNGDGMIDENEPYRENPYYYYGDTEITKEEYASYQVPGDYLPIGANKSAKSILSQLNGEPTKAPANHDDAYNIAKTWLDAHPAMGVVGVTISGIATDLYKADGASYYKFDLNEMYYANMLVDSKTGEVWITINYDGEYPYSEIEWADDYYNEYFSGVQTSSADETPYKGEPVSADDLIGEYRYDKLSTVYVSWADSELMVAVISDDFFMVDNERISPDRLTGNKLVFASSMDPMMYETHSLTYIPAKDAPSGKDTIYFDDNKSMPYVRE